MKHPSHRPFRTLAALVLCIALCACGHPQPPSAEGNAVKPTTIEVIGFADCPHTAGMLETVRAAAERLGLPDAVTYVDQVGLDPGDTKRGWPAPTVLVDGNDLFGMPTPTSLTAGCRIYEDGMPTLDEISSRLATHLKSK